MFYKNELPWAIQKMAADGAGGGAGAEEGTGDASGTNENDGNEPKGVSFDDFLKDKANQAEFDRRVAKALETQKGKLDKDYADKLAAQKTEAEKLARMNAEQKAEYEKLFCNPYDAAHKGYIDDVIEPRNTRFRVIRALEKLHNKRVENPAKKHDNLPL